MAGTYSQIYFHIVFAVKGRENLIGSAWKNELYKYMGGIIVNKKQTPIIINGVADHVHVLLGMKPSVCPADLVRDIKNNASRFVNERHFVNERFAWQEGYGIFSCGYSQLNMVSGYIANQEAHHRKRTFREEYVAFLDELRIPYEERFLFEWIED